MVHNNFGLFKEKASLVVVTLIDQFFLTFWIMSLLNSLSISLLTSQARVPMQEDAFSLSLGFGSVFDCRLVISSSPFRDPSR